MQGGLIDTVIFDMDDVLCDYDREARIRHMAETTGLAPDAIVAAIWTSGFDEAADEGDYGPDDYMAETRARLGVDISKADWAEARRISMTPRPNVLAMARQVGERATIACLTNNGLLMREMMPVIFPEAPALFGERMFFSAELGAGKPKREAFDAVLRRIGGTAAHALFIDDSAEYIAGAEAAGLHVHQYQDEDTLRRTLDGFGLL